MFLKVHHRSKDGKDHRYYSLVESVRTSRGPQHRTLAYLGELNGSTESAWRKSVAVFNGDGTETQLELFASDAPVVPSGERVVQVVLDRVRWERPRDFGEVFLARHLWRLLGLDELLEERMGRGGEEIPWPVMAFILTAARLIAPASELGIEERFYPKTALEDICGVAEEQVNKDRLYRALDHLLPHKAALEGHLKSRIGTLFDEPFDILLYDLTSTYFEGLGEGNPQARRGYSRDHRPDCVQVVIGLVVTKSGLPLGYEVFAGNQAEPPTLDEMMAKMEALYGNSRLRGPRGSRARGHGHAHRDRGRRPGRAGDRGRRVRGAGQGDQGWCHLRERPQHGFPGRRDPGPDQVGLTPHSYRPGGPYPAPGPPPPGRPSLTRDLIDIEREQASSDAVWRRSIPSVL